MNKKFSIFKKKNHKKIIIIMNKLKIRKLVQVLKLIKFLKNYNLEISMKVNIKMTLKMGMVNLYGVVVIIMKENLKITKDMVLEKWYGLMAVIIKVLGFKVIYIKNFI